MAGLSEAEASHAVSWSGVQHAGVGQSLERVGDFDGLVSLGELVSRGAVHP
jgi:hypothetical protein